MNLPARLIASTYMVATLASLTSAIAANYLHEQLVNQQHWLAVGIFMLLTAASIGFTLYQQGFGSPLGKTLPGLNRATHKELLTLLLPLMERENERRSLLYQALGEHPLYHQIDYSGAARPFTINMLAGLARAGEIAPGKPALAVLLEVVVDLVGSDQQTRLRALLAKLAQPVSPRVLTTRGKVGAVALFAILIAFVGLVSPSVSRAAAQVAPSCPPTRICLAVADFMTADGTTALSLTNDVYQLIDRVLARSEAGLAESKRLILRRINKQVDQGQAASQSARTDGDLLIVWGYVGTLPDERQRITVNFEFADPMQVGQAESTVPFRAQPLLYAGVDEFCRECLSLDWAEAKQHLYLVAHTTAGLAHYVQRQPGRARLDFMAALYCAGELATTDALITGRTPCVPTAASERPPLGLLYYYIGKAYFLEGDYAQAIHFLEEAAKRNPRDPAAQIGIGAAYKAWLALPTQGTAVRIAIAQTPLVSTALQTAITLAGELLAAPHLAPAAYFDRGLAYELAGDAQAAQADYQRAAEALALQEGGSEYVALIGLARAQRAAQNQAGARATLERALAVAPAPLPWAYIELAYIEADARQRAEAWLAQAEQIAPEEAAVAITRAELCEQWHAYDCAEEAYQAALVKQPESGRLYSQLGNFYLPGATPLAHQRWALAETYYRAAAEVWRPNDPWAHERLAYVLFNQQAYGEAAYHYQRTIDLAYNGTAPAGIYCNLGLAQQQAGQTAQAIEDYERCAKFATDDAQRAKAAELLKQVK